MSTSETIPSVVWVEGGATGAGAVIRGLLGEVVVVDKMGGACGVIQIQEYCVRPSEG
jgi:hypothetical protein